MTEIEAALKAVEDAGCSCDLGNSWVCGVHEKIAALKKLLTEKGVLSSGDGTCVRHDGIHPYDSTCSEWKRVFTPTDRNPMTDAPCTIKIEDLPSGTGGKFNEWPANLHPIQIKFEGRGFQAVQRSTRRVIAWGSTVGECYSNAAHAAYKLGMELPRHPTGKPDTWFGG